MLHHPAYNYPPLPAVPALVPIGKLLYVLFYGEAHVEGALGHEPLSAQRAGLQQGF